MSLLVSTPPNPLRVRKSFQSSSWHWLGPSNVEYYEDRRALLVAVLQERPFETTWGNKGNGWVRVSTAFASYLEKERDYRKPPADTTLSKELSRLIEEFKKAHTTDEVFDYESIEGECLDLTAQIIVEQENYTNRAATETTSTPSLLGEEARRRIMDNQLVVSLDEDSDSEREDNARAKVSPLKRKAVDPPSAPSPKRCRVSDLLSKQHTEGSVKFRAQFLEQQQGLSSSSFERVLLTLVLQSQQLQHSQQQQLLLQQQQQQLQLYIQQLQHQEMQRLLVALVQQRSQAIELPSSQQSQQDDFLQPIQLEAVESPVRTRNQFIEE